MAEPGGTEHGSVPAQAGPGWPPELPQPGPHPVGHPVPQPACAAHQPGTCSVTNRLQALVNCYDLSWLPHQAASGIEVVPSQLILLTLSQALATPHADLLLHCLPVASWTWHATT